MKSLSRPFTSIPILIYEKYKQIYKCASKWSPLGVFSRIYRNNYQKNNNIPKHVDSTISKLEKFFFLKTTSVNKVYRLVSLCQWKWSILFLWLIVSILTFKKRTKNKIGFRLLVFKLTVWEIELCNIEKPIYTIKSNKWVFTISKYWEQIKFQFSFINTVNILKISI